MHRLFFPIVFFMFLSSTAVTFGQDFDDGMFSFKNYSNKYGVLECLVNISYFLDLGL